MVRSSSQLAIAAVGILVVAAVGLLVLPEGSLSFEQHQVPPAPETPGTPETPGVGSTPGADPPTTELPVEVEGTVPGQATHVRVYSPVDARVTLVDLTADANGMTMTVLGERVADAPGPAVPILYTGDLVRDEKVGFTLDLPTGAQHVEVDRSTAPATIRLPELDLTILGPIAWRGQATGPSEVGVYDIVHEPATPVFHYQAMTDGTAVLTMPDGTQTTVFQQLITLEGSPAGPEWSLVLRDAQGSQVLRSEVPVALVNSQISALVPGTPLDPYLHMVKNAALEVPSYKAATDGVRTLDPANLTGARFLNGQVAQGVMVDVPQEKDLGAPILLLDVEPPNSATSERVPMHAAAREQGFVRYAADVPDAWVESRDDGTTVHFAILYRTSVANVVVEDLMDDNDGAAYRYRLDKAAPEPPQVRVNVPKPAEPTKLRVTWETTDVASGVASYKVEKGRVVDTQTTWEPWIAATKERGADFTGIAGETYRFRVRATDLVGLEGAATESREHLIPTGGSGATNEAPTVRLMNPVGGEAYASQPVITILWEAADADGTTPVINLYTSKDGGLTWKPLASPKGDSYEWDISALGPGTDYRVKVEATDGSLSNQDVSGKFSIDNDALPKADSVGGPGGKDALRGGTPPVFSPPKDTAPPAGAGPGAVLGMDLMLVALLAIVAVALIGGLAVWRIKRKR